MQYLPLKSVLLTGAAGYVGSTLSRRLLADGCQVVGLDNYARGHADALPSGMSMIRGDIRDPDAIRQALQLFARPPQACIHLASYILVGESVHEPQLYHDINSIGTQVVAEVCLDAGVSALTLASSAAVLSAQQHGADRLDEDAFIGPESPYGESKVAGERTLAALAQTGKMSAVALRLFNVAGAAYGMAERHDPETHLIPLALRAAVGELPRLKVFGAGLGTPDGSCLRDYVHMHDVLEAFVRATARSVALRLAGDASYDVFHVGSGVGRSVLEVISVCEQVLGRSVPWQQQPPRAGDVPILVADPTRLMRELQFTPDADLPRMVRDCALALGMTVADV